MSMKWRRREADDEFLDVAFTLLEEPMSRLGNGWWTPLAYYSVFLAMDLTAYFLGLAHHVSGVPWKFWFVSGSLVFILTLILYVRASKAE